MWLRSLPDPVPRESMLDGIRATGDAHFLRLGLEYLPFRFSRRHGDPSRPWNTFSIRVRDGDGKPILYYEGNWRDIFQNWEALCMSFPEFLTGVIAVFVNASTADGFNPYRITRDGIDWEVPDPDDPWSHIGYWGDHQIVYLLRLLEMSDRFLPGELASLLGEQLFSYADVPYRIAPYEELLRDPKTTIAFHEEASAGADARVDELGGDGRLLRDEEGEVYLATLAEKLLVPALAKLCNFVPGGGIWMNTQRPEWNDANNALVGFGLSMVTLYHLRRYLEYLGELIGSAGLASVAMSVEVAAWLRAVTGRLQEFRDMEGETQDADRRRLMDALGRAFDTYRTGVYDSGLSGRSEVSVDEIGRLCEIAVAVLDRTIHANRRSDGLFHAYNLVRFEPDGPGAAIERLPEMLEGQVAVLDSGVLSPEDRADVIDALFSSPMYRADQASFMLYPIRRLPTFLEKNVVPEGAIDTDLLLQQLEAGDRSVVAVASDGRVRFNPSFSNRRDLERALDELEAIDRWSDVVFANRARTMETYEAVFGHHAYTGRSGSMYGYEGIGSIYWHMVAKLLVAVQQSVLEATRARAPHAVTSRLIDAYWRIRAGLGFNKTAAEFGAIPLDPYSHTPEHAGAQQPGMTGLVKEELLTRPLELGVRVEHGSIVFDPVLLRFGEFLERPESWSPYGVAMEPVVIELGAGSLGATLCQTPFVVSIAHEEPHLEIEFADGTSTRLDGLTLDRETSAEVFARSGAIRRIDAHIPSDLLGRSAAG